MEKDSNHLAILIILFPLLFPMLEFLTKPQIKLHLGMSENLKVRRISEIKEEKKFLVNSAAEVLNMAFKKSMEETSIQLTLGVDFGLCLKRIEEKFEKTIVAFFEPNKIVGVFIYSQKPGKDEFTSIGPIAVSPNHQNQGIGNKMYQYFFSLDLFQSYRLCVDCHNSGALFLYLKQGFKIFSSLILLYKEINLKDLTSQKIFETKEKYKEANLINESILSKAKEYIKLNIGYPFTFQKEALEDYICIMDKNDEICGFSSSLSISGVTISNNKDCLDKMIEILIKRKIKNKKSNLKINFLVNSLENDVVNHLLKKKFRIRKSMYNMNKGKFIAPKKDVLFFPAVVGIF